MANPIGWGEGAKLSWPYDAPNRIFFGRAVHRIGQQLFGNDWSPADPLANPIVASELSAISVANADRSQRERAWLLIAGRHPERPQPGAVFGSGRLRPLLDLTEEDWKLARSIDAEQVAQRRKATEPLFDAKARYRRVKDFIRENCQWGRLSSFYQAVDGEFHPVKITLWNTDRPEQWFRFGKLTGRDALGDWSRDHVPKYWLFFATDMLGALTLDKSGIPTQQKTHAGGRKEFERTFRKMVQDSPLKRTATRAEIEELTIRLGLSGRQADAVRKTVLKEFGEPTWKAWAGGGAPSKEG
jgi:hypothetical protein